MVFETKLDIDEDMWYMHDNKAISQKVKNIRISSISGETTILYSIHGGHTTSSDWFMECSKVFKTKEELLASL